MKYETRSAKRKLTEAQTPSHKTQKLRRQCQSQSHQGSPEIAENRLSELPNSVMRQILSLCPVEEAVRICTLLRQWKSLWTSMPELSFDCDSFEDAYKAASFIDNVLTLYSAPKVKKFFLEFPFGEDNRFKDRVDSWLRFAVTHEAEELYLSLPFVRNLSNDVLGGCSWMSLKVLSLDSVKLKMETITSIFHGSPLLKCLTLSFCELIGNSYVIDVTNTKLKELVLDCCKIIFHFNENEFHAAARRCVEIQAPNLRSLTVKGYRSFILIDVSSLVEAKIDLQMKSVTALEKKMIMDILDKLFHVNRLTVGIWILKVLAIMRLDGEILPTLRCKTLKVKMNLHKRYLPGVEALLDSSPYMEQLIMYVSVPDDSEYMNRRIKQLLGKNYWRSEAMILSCLNNSLRRVEVIGLVDRRLRGWRSRIQILVGMMHFLLDNAKVLQKLIIHTPPDRQNKLLGIKEKILSHPRASPNAQVEFV